jgi:hypothetical protein
MLRNGITTALKRSTTNHDRFARSRSPALHRSAATLPPPRRRTAPASRRSPLRSH